MIQSTYKVGIKDWDIERKRLDSMLSWKLIGYQYHREEDSMSITVFYRGGAV